MCNFLISLLAVILSMRKFPSGMGWQQQESMQINSVSKQTHLRFQSIGRRTHRACVNTLLSGWWHPITTTTENSSTKASHTVSNDKYPFKIPSLTKKICVLCHEQLNFLAKSICSSPQIGSWFFWSKRGPLQHCAKQCRKEGGRLSSCSFRGFSRQLGSE